MAQKILITGGTGLVGSKLVPLLQEQGYEVRLLSRTKKSGAVPRFQWNVSENYIDDAAFEGISYIIHLAGAGVAEGRWTDDRKKEFFSSRVDATNLLLKKVKELDVKLEAFLCASAVGIYGNYEGSEVKTEESPFASDYLAKLTVDWENAAENFQKEGIRTVKFRIGVVLSETGGALKKIAQPIKLFAGAPLGPGNQYMSWVHIGDLCRMIAFAIENKEMQGPYNAVNPNPVTNKEMTKIIAKTLKKPLWLPNVPSFVLKMMFGEMASIVLGGSVVSSSKIEAAGFNPEFTEAQSAISDLLSDN